MLNDFIAKETDVTKGTVYIISGILTAEDNGTEITGTGLCQPIYFLNDILYQNAVSHDGLPVNMSGRF